MSEREHSSVPVPMQVLIVDDEDIMRRVWRRILKAPEFELRFATNAEDAFNVLSTTPLDVVVMDVIMPGLSGMEALPRLKSRWPAVEVVMMTAYGGMDSAVQAVSLGAYDFLTKPFISVESAALAIRHAGNHKRLTDRARELEQDVRGLREERELRDVLGCSPRMQEVVRLATAAAATAAPVLLQGEPGTEKELLARLLHRQSARRGGPFMALNCANLAEPVLHAELLGRGGDVGAGLLEAASGGTLFLDEVGGLPLRLQLPLVSLTSADESPTARTPRLVAGCSRDLEDLIREGTVRDELGARLISHRIRVPALRERLEDIVPLSYYHLQRAARRLRREVLYLSRPVMLALQSHSWPGNVRELESTIERAVVATTGDTIGLDALPAVMRGQDASLPALDSLLSENYRAAKEQATATFDRIYIEQLLEKAGGNVTQAARMAGLDRSNFRRVLKRARRPE